MICGVPFCTADAVGEWIWSRDGNFPIRYPICTEHRTQKAKSRAPGTFIAYTSTP
jgi:hypothetical protein